MNLEMHAVSAQITDRNIELSRSAERYSKLGPVESRRGILPLARRSVRPIAGVLRLGHHSA
jgi:hypothetical protein